MAFIRGFDGLLIQTSPLISEYIYWYPFWFASLLQAGRFPNWERPACYHQETIDVNSD